ncbi:MAG: hypothetical protein ACR2OH_09425 [Microthrixaceae bacterium]
MQTTNRILYSTIAIAVVLAAGALATSCSSDDDNATDTDSSVELPEAAADTLAAYDAAVFSGDGETMLEYVTNDFTFLSYGDELQQREFRAEYVTENYTDFDVEVIGPRTAVGDDEAFVVSRPERAMAPVNADGFSTIRIVESSDEWLVDAHRFVGQ